MASRKSSSKSSSPAIKVGVDKDSSVSVSQIENGFLITESGSTGKGRNQKWYNKQFYSKTNPLKITGSTPSTGGKGSFGSKK